MDSDSDSDNDSNHEHTQDSDPDNDTNYEHNNQDNDSDNESNQDIFFGGDFAIRTYIDDCKIIIKNVALHNPTFEKNDWDKTFKHLVLLYTNDEEVQNKMFEVMKTHYGMYYNVDLRTLITFTEKELATIYKTLKESNIMKKNDSKTTFPYIKLPDNLNLENDQPYPIKLVPFTQDITGVEKETVYKFCKLYSKRVTHNKLYIIYSNLSLMANLLFDWEKKPNINQFKNLSAKWNKSASYIFSILKVNIHHAKKPRHYSKNRYEFINYVYSNNKNMDINDENDRKLMNSRDVFKQYERSIDNKNKSFIELFKQTYPKDYGIITQSIDNNTRDDVFIHGNCLIPPDNIIKCLKFHIISLEKQNCKETLESMKKPALIWGPARDEPIAIRNNQNIKTKINQICLPCPCIHYKRIKNNQTEEYNITKMRCSITFNINIPDNIIALKRTYSLYDHTSEYKKFVKLLEKNIDRTL